MNFKLIAIAAAIASMAGTAQADLTPASTGNGSLSVVAFNTVSRAFYIRDTGLRLNDFIPSGITTLAGDGGVVGGAYTPDSGFEFSLTDTSFSTWLTGQDTSAVRWLVTASDSTSSAANGRSRLITSSAIDTLVIRNDQITNYTGSGNVGNLSTLAGGIPFTASFFAASGAPGFFDTNFGLGATTLASLDQEAGLYYAARTTATGSTSATQMPVRYGNANGFATETLASDGNFTYSVPTAPIPEPSTLWLLGAGLMTVGALARRRQAAPQA